MPSTNMRKACSDASSVSERTHPLLRRRTCLSHVSCSRFFQKHVPDERRLSQTRQTRQGWVEFFLERSDVALLQRIRRCASIARNRCTPIPRVARKSHVARKSMDHLVSMPSTNMRKACSDASSVSERTHPLLRRRTCLSHVSCSRFFQKHVPDERRLSQTRQTRQGWVEFFLERSDVALLQRIRRCASIARNRCTPIPRVARKSHVARKSMDHLVSMPSTNMRKACSDASSVSERTHPLLRRRTCLSHVSCSRFFQKHVPDERRLSQTRQTRQGWVEFFLERSDVALLQRIRRCASIARNRCTPIPRVARKSHVARKSMDHLVSMPSTNMRKACSDASSVSERTHPLLRRRTCLSHVSCSRFFQKHVPDERRLSQTRQTRQGWVEFFLERSDVALLQRIRRCASIARNRCTPIPRVARKSHVARKSMDHLVSMPSTNMRKACSDASSVSERTHPLLRRRTCLSHVSCSRFFQKHVPDERRLSQTRRSRQGSVEFLLDAATWLFSNESVVAPQLHATGARRFRVLRASTPTADPLPASGTTRRKTKYLAES